MYQVRRGLSVSMISGEIKESAPPRGKKLFFLQSFRTCSGPHTSSYIMIFSPEVKRPGM
jgi:hypothetical protein